MQQQRARAKPWSPASADGKCAAEAAHKAAESCSWCASAKPEEATLGVTSFPVVHFKACCDMLQFGLPQDFLMVRKIEHPLLETWQSGAVSIHVHDRNASCCL